MVFMAPFTERSENPRKSQRSLTCPKKMFMTLLFETDYRPLETVNNDIFDNGINTESID